MKRGRPRQYDPTIPAHVDQAKIPAGAYWDRRDRVWYTHMCEGNKARRKRLAGASATLADLHRLIEELAQSSGPARGTIEWLQEKFTASDQWKALAPATQRDYAACLLTLQRIKTRLGGTVAELQVDRLRRVDLQQLVDKIATDRPALANHVKRWLGRLFAWGMQRGHMHDRTNPAHGLDAARERKRRRLPSADVYVRMLQYARDNHTDYLWIAMELAYLLRLRGIEVVTLTDAHVSPEEGIHTNRRKGSRDSLVQWSPRLRAAHDAALARRKRIWAARKVPMPLRNTDRRLLVNDRGQPLNRRALSTLWQTMMVSAVAKGIITDAERFGAHDLKRKGITETKGTRAEKREASGHKAEAMMDVYDLSVPVVTTPGDE